jgi:hypothetical protein
VLASSIDNASVLRALGVLLVALVWLFFFRVVRAVWAEVRPPRRWRRLVEAAMASDANASRPRRSRELRLRVVQPPEARGRIYEIPAEATVGRAPGCAVRLDDAFCSNLHARLYHRDGELWVEDLGSTNGTWVNRHRVNGPTKLSKGDMLQVGGVVFEVSR